MVGEVPNDLAGKLLTHAESRLVDRDVVDNRVGTREVNMLENTGRVTRLAAEITGVQNTVVFNVDTLAGPHVAQAIELERVQCHALRSHHVVLAPVFLALTEHQRPNAIGVAERDDAETDDQRNHGVAAPAPRMHGLDGVKHVLGRR